jgi:hypothetical protein
MERILWTGANNDPEVSLWGAVQLGADGAPCISGPGWRGWFIRKVLKSSVYKPNSRLHRAGS